MQRSDCFVSVVAPLSNDAAIVEAFVVETMDVLRAHYANYELVLVDDGSTDDTMAVLGRLLSTQECIRVIRLSRRFGTEIAIASGLDAVIGDFVVVMLPDSGPVRLIPEVIRQAQAGQDVVFGIRRSRAGEPVWWRIGSRLFYWVSTRLVGLDLPQDATEFQVLSRRAVNAIIQIKDKYRYLRILSAYVGYANRGFVYEPISRYGRPKRKGIAEGLNLAIGIIATNSTRPLRFVGLLAAGASILSGAYFAYAVLISLLGWRGAEGVTALTLLNTGVFCLILGVLAVLAEYVGRILDESRDRPLYYVLEERSSSVLLADTYRRNVVRESQPTSAPVSPDPVRTPTR
jgi:dolichol-phosphate mannosyltransferase